MSRQLALPLESRNDYEIAMMRAWSRSGMRVPYHVAIRIPALAICLRNVANAEIRRRVRRTRLAFSAMGSEPPPLEPTNVGFYPH